MHVIYLLQNLVNGKVYVGKTAKSAEVRFTEHIKEAQRGSDRRLCQALRKHGVEAFSLRTLEQVADASAAAKRERFWISHYNSRDYQLGYNMTDGGEGAPGMLVTEETRNKMRAAANLRISQLSQEERQDMTKAANESKRGRKEKPGSSKSIAQKQRWAGATSEEKAEHGARSKAGVSEIGKLHQTAGMTAAFSPEREKGVPKAVVQCPYCGKVGGRPIMHRFHFEKCKHREYFRLGSEPVQSG